VQRANAPGTWNFNELSTPDVDAAIAFYAAVFGWEFAPLDFGGETSWMVRRPGYGQFLTRYDPDILERQAEAGAPEGFADAVAWISKPDSERLTETPRWTMTFAVSDADAIARRAAELGGSVLVKPMDASDEVRVAVVADPAGAVFTVSRYAPAFDQ
jgi:predicted enzyme related to lactoylglutathione lyase